MLPIAPWEIEKMLAARQHFEETRDSVLDLPHRFEQAMLKWLGAGLGLILIGWLLSRKVNDA
ncbi:MAG: hypothetical protein LC687_05320 [Actinobacteria bacterium]|nr:hypothetical protein [Actinomycetota bacterium]MCA1807250.1 hypothetical protein [Actinomycetota bacterium]